MKITWLGHACFLLETEKGVKIITDPYEKGSYGGAIGYDSIDIDPDIVTVSHQHADHNYTKDFSGATIIEKGDKVWRIADTEIKGIVTFHDKEMGAARGDNIIYMISADGLRIAHFGDLGSIEIDASKLQNIDIALIPVGGIFTINSQEADQLIEKINPRIVIPMHYKTPKLGFDIDGVDKFLEGKRDYERADCLEVNLQNISSLKRVVVLSSTQINEEENYGRHN